MSVPTVAVAVSGGRDSTALLHVTCRAARDAGLRVVALHVHHGLMPQADAWVDHLRSQCARWRRAGLPVVLRWQRLSGAPGPGESVEAWARHERYRALAEMARAQGACVVLLAHHRQDQAETFLLQALRSGSPRGLAGMPREVQRDGLCWVRPWLGQDPSRIDAYVRRHRLGFVVDASNADPRFARSRLRTAVWPALQQAFPGAPGALAAAAARAHEAAQCLRALAEQDLQPCTRTDGGLERRPWLGLAPERRANALRHWLAEHVGPSLPESLVGRLLDELPAGRSGLRWPAGAGELLLYRGVLAWRGAAHRGVASLPSAAHRGTAPDAPQRIDLASSRSPVALPAWRGRLHVRRVPEGGMPRALLQDAELRARQGAERFQAAPAGLPRSLKKAYQSAGVPPSHREGPLVFAGDRLVFVPGLGLDARVRQRHGEDLVELDWVAEPD